MNHAVGWGRVRGATTYVADVRAPEALHVAFVYSPEPHARIQRIDMTAALAVPGVVDAITGQDIGKILVGRRLQDYPVLAGDRVLFVGQRVAAIAAIDRETARAAAALVEVEYEPLPAVFGLDQAARTEDVLHPDYAEYAGALTHRAGPNTQGLSESESGQVDAEFAASQRVFDDTFTCGRSHSAPMEPHACVVSVTQGRVDVWATNKEPYRLRSFLAATAGLPADAVRVHLCPLGGDFGSKGFPYAELACYALSARTGRPVRHTMGYDEELTTTASRHAMTVRLRTAVTDGTIRGFAAESLLDGGAFGALKPVPGIVVPVVGAPFGSYDVSDRRERCVTYYTNVLPAGHVRSPGEFQALFAAESQVDIIAIELGTDPIEFRLANAANDRVRRVLEEMRAVVRNWNGDGTNGVGVALSFRDAGAGSTTVRCIATPEGVEIQLSTPDQGAGSYALFQRLAAQTLGVPLTSVQIRALPVGTDETLQDSGAGGSRVTAVAGGAVLDGCRALLAKLGGMPDRAGTYWPAGRLTELGQESVGAEGTATTPRPTPPELEARSYAAVGVELSVDAETGQVQLHRAAVVADTGHVLNPVAHRGQLEGGFIYGLSQTLLEELTVDDGQVTTPTLGDYRIVSAADIPPLDIRVLPPDPADDRIRSVGELINIVVAPAVANAVFNAVGARVRELPLTPERILQAMSASRR
jgi:aerobic carbon-monoxide dehydrogenase large subunit